MIQFRRYLALGLVAVVVLALASGVYAYWKLNSPSQFSPVSSTFRSYPIEFGIELNRTQFAVGERLVVQFYLKNISNKTIVASFGDAKVFDFNVTDANGTPVFVLSQNLLYTQAPVSHLLQTNQILHDTFPWDQTYGTIALQDKYQQPVPPGTYRIEGLTAESMLVSYWDGQTQILPTIYYRGEPTGVEGELRTPKITFTIA